MRPGNPVRLSTQAPATQPVLIDMPPFPVPSPEERIVAATRSQAGGSPDSGPPESKTNPLRWPVAAERGSALVGREADIARIARRLEKTRHSGNSLLAVFGEAGIGKTRLAWATAE